MKKLKTKYRILPLVVILNAVIDSAHLLTINNKVLIVTFTSMISGILYLLEKIGE